MHVPESCPEIVAADVLLIRADPRASGCGHGLQACRGAPSARDRVDAGREQEHAAGDDEVDVRRLVEQAQAVVDRGDHQTTDDGVAAPALAAEEAGAADDGRADGVQQRVAAARPGETLPAYDAWSMPLSAAIDEQMTNTEMRIRSTLMPARRAASVLPPTA